MTTATAAVSSIRDMIRDAIMTIVGIEAITAVIVFLIIIPIVTGKDGVTGKDNIVVIHTNTEEDVITMTTEEISCLSTVKTTETVPPVSRSEFTSKVPCNKCLMLVMCKQRMKINNSVVSFAHSKHGCPEAKEFVTDADMNEINNMRIIFGLEIYP